MITYNKKITTNQILNANINGPAAALKNIVMYSVVANITGVPTGTLTLQASNDPETNTVMPLNNPQPPPTVWATIANSNFTVTTAGVTMWNVSDVAYNYVRVVYTDASSGASTAHMDVVVNAKGV